MESSMPFVCTKFIDYGSLMLT